MNETLSTKLTKEPSEEPDQKDDVKSNTILEQLCRCCLIPIDKTFFWIESYYLNKKFIEIYKNVTSIEVDLTEKKPNKICISCYNTILKFEKFKTKALESEKLLSGTLFTESADPGSHSEFIFVRVENDDKEYESDIPDDNDNASDRTHSDNEEKVIKRREDLLQDELKALGDELKLQKQQLAETYKSSQPSRQVRRQGRYRKVVCEDCGRVIAATKMEVHSKTHIKPYDCNECDKSFTEQNILFEHKKSEHGYKDEFKCKMCSEEFINPSDLKDHETTEHVSEENSSLCPICAKTFKSVGRLSMHMKGVHENDNFKKAGTGFSCSVCGNVYKYKANLVLHQKAHIHPKPYLCTTCGKKYSTKAVLQNHQKVHTGEKDIECSFCNKKFRFVSSYRTHLMIHKGEKPLVCPICNKRFRQHSHLKTHVRGQHTGIRPYECSFCQKTFKHSCNLTVHTRIHTGETPYVCDICKRGFYDSSSMKKHRKSHIEPSVSVKTEQELMEDLLSGDESFEQD